MRHAAPPYLARRDRALVGQRRSGVQIARSSVACDKSPISTDESQVGREAAPAGFRSLRYTDRRRRAWTSAERINGTITPGAGTMEKLMRASELAPAGR